MKVLYFDCFSGISGDMTLAALLDLGIDETEFRKELDKLGLTGYRLQIEKVQKSGIYGTDVTVIVENDVEERHLEDIELLIDRSGLKQNVKDFSKKVFREIARAEAKVHNKDINEIHFHEVGAIDSIVDIVGCAICIDLLGVDKVYSSVLHDGKGFVKCSHGIIPVPVPAVVEMLAGSNIPFRTIDVDTELITPTGMGLIKSLASGFGNMPMMTVEKTGYGMGKRETGRLNALRVVMGELMDEKDINDEANDGKEKELDRILILETNIDNMNPEILGYTLDQLMEAGALDVFYTPVYMKKNRPGVLLTVLGRVEDEDKLVDIIFSETSTIGVRKYTTLRYCMDREIQQVETGYGPVKVKVSYRDGIRKAAPEYEDCKEIARKNNIPLREVYNEVYGKMCNRFNINK